MVSKEDQQVVPAGFGRGRRTNRIVVVETVTSSTKDIPSQIERWGEAEERSTWARMVCDACLTAAEKTGFDLTWHFWVKGETPESLAQRIAEQADGAIVIGPEDDHLALLSELADRGLPGVVLCGSHPRPDVPYVLCDNAGGIKLVVKHLVELGHRRIGYLGGTPESLDFRERARAFLEAMAGEGLTVDPSLVVEVATRQFEEETARLATALLCRADRPTALVCAGDSLAAIVLQRAWQLGLNPPKDLAVTGFDDTGTAIEVMPELTTVHQPIAQIANEAWYLAACTIVGQQPESPGWQLRMPVSLVVRESCGTSLKTGGKAVPRRLSRPVRHETELRLRQLAAINQEMAEVLHVASHDFRAPLISINGLASSLERRYGKTLDRPGRQYVQRICANAEHLDEMVTALLALSREHDRPLRFARVHVYEVLTRVLHDLAGLITEKRAQIIGVNKRLPSILADEAAVYEIFLNLIGNAVKYAREGRRPEVMIRHQQGEEEYEFSVQDNGIGISPENQEEIFQVLRRLSRSGEAGVGLGLAIAKRLVLRHGGRIWVESLPGQGATFRFTLARHQAESEVAVAEIPGRALPAGKPAAGGISRGRVRATKQGRTGRRGPHAVLCAPESRSTVGG